MTRIVLLVLLSLHPLLTWAAIQFPPLTGRVVDNADMLSAAEEQQLTALLADHEQRTTNQVVVVTLPNLQGFQIEEFGYQLGRHWGIGQKDKNNGVLLIVAHQERAVRIEVGYGLEGTLTDALAKTIIDTRIVSAFRLGRFGLGITDGAKETVQVLEGTYQPKKDSRPPVDPNALFARFVLMTQHYESPWHRLVSTTLFLILVLIFWRGFRRGLDDLPPDEIQNDFHRDQYRKDSNFSRHDGFRGGGGSYGGGGASGRW